MSGGHFDYNQFRLEEISDSIDRLIANNDVKNEWGNSRSYSPETLERFKEATHNIRRAEEMATRVDWLASGDDSEESFHKRWKEEVREPWTNT